MAHNLFLAALGFEKQDLFSYCKLVNLCHSLEVIVGDSDCGAAKLRGVHCPQETMRARTAEKGGYGVVPIGSYLSMLNG